MKNLALIIIFVFTFAVFVNAQSNKQIVVQVPFDFYVQNQKLNAGDYLIENASSQSNQSTLIIREKSGKAKGILTTNLIELAKDRKSFAPTIIFNRYGNEYVLAEIRNPLEDIGFTVRIAKTEKYLAKQFGKPTQETIAVNPAQK